MPATPITEVLDVACPRLQGPHLDQMDAEPGFSPVEVAHGIARREPLGNMASRPLNIGAVSQWGHNMPSDFGRTIPPQTPSKSARAPR